MQVRDNCCPPPRLNALVAKRIQEQAKSFVLSLAQGQWSQRLANAPSTELKVSFMDIHLDTSLTRIFSLNAPITKGNKNKKDKKSFNIFTCLTIKEGKGNTSLC